MIYILAFGAFGLMAIFSAYYIITNTRSDFLEFVCFIAIVIGFIIEAFTPCLLLGYVEASFKAEIINKEFNTNYTTEQVLFAEDVIDEIRQIKRKRIEVNGDLLK